MPVPNCLRTLLEEAEISLVTVSVYIKSGQDEIYKVVSGAIFYKKA